MVEGDNVFDVDTQYEQISEDDFDVIVTLTVETEYFSCAHCGLILDDYQILDEAGVADTFEAEGDSSHIQYEGDYGND